MDADKPAVNTTQPALPPRMPDYYRARGINIALLGLGSAGELFAENILERIQIGNMPIRIVAVADHDPGSPVALGFAQHGIPVFRHAFEIVQLGKKIDVIFDLTGDMKLRRALRLQLRDLDNRHTVIVPEVVAWMLWLFFTKKNSLPPTLNPGY